ncbi:MAG: hypothetical protein PHH54_01085 [Candidatus Nanoarchaeia archaeon]|nr:hypothetical protein [Candidatus Nanoarchaeia archaeon]MDD5740558.1 hypothetical protein [Candidatus Nanoarchaeia archaeon]
MKKSFILPILALFLLVSISYVAACDYNNQSDCPFGWTIVRGRIYDITNNNAPVGNAIVNITCDGHSQIVKSLNNDGPNSIMLKGSYFVMFPQSQCEDGDEAIVTATKGELSGENSGEIENTAVKCLDVGIINVPLNLIPEFGLFAGSLTLVSAVGVFFLVRRR